MKAKIILTNASSHIEFTCNCHLDIESVIFEEKELDYEIITGFDTINFKNPNYDTQSTYDFIMDNYYSIVYELKQNYMTVKFNEPVYIEL